MPPTSAQHRRRRYHDEGELQIVHHDLAVAEAKRLQDGNLLTLQCQQPRQHGIGHERRHTQKDHWEADGQNVQHANLIRHADVRGMIGPAKGAAARRTA